MYPTYQEVHKYVVVLESGPPLSFKNGFQNRLKWEF
jgi:hypothetical protein